MGLTEQPSPFPPNQCPQAQVTPQCIAGAPRANALYSDANHDTVILTLVAGIDAREAASELKKLGSGFEMIPAGLFKTPVANQLVAPSQCDRSAKFSSDSGCAWQTQSAPHVGNEAKAYRSDLNKDFAQRAILFRRDTTAVSVVVALRTATGSTPVPDAAAQAQRIANQIARTLDDEVQQALH